MNHRPPTTEVVIDACIPRNDMERIDRIMSWAESVDWAPSERDPLTSALRALTKYARTTATDYPGDYIEDRMLSLIGEALSGYGYMIELNAGDVLVIPCDDRENDA